MHKKNIQKSTELLGKETVEMLLRIHEDSLWAIEGLGVKCTEPEIQDIYSSTDGALVYEDKIYLSKDLVEDCIEKTPGRDQFFVKEQSFLVGGTAPYVYDDINRRPGIVPTLEHVEKLAQIVENKDTIAGMGEGFRYKDNVKQLETMAKHCSKPMFFSVNDERMFEATKELLKERDNVFTFCSLTRSPLEVQNNLVKYFIKSAQEGFPIGISALGMGGLTTPRSYTGSLTITHAEALFGICTGQIINPGITMIHGGFPTMVDPFKNYNPTYGGKEHNMLNILLSHLNGFLDIPSFHCAASTDEDHITPKALQDASIGYSLVKKYGAHMMRQSFGMLKYLVDFSLEKTVRTADILEKTTAEAAPDVKMPKYDPQSINLIKSIGHGNYKDTWIA